jgi:hypothetical protein
MLIPGIPDEELERLHYNYGGGRGAAGYRHIPSGITVVRESPPDAPTQQIYEEAMAELERELRRRDLITDQRDKSAEADEKVVAPDYGDV